MRIAIFVLPFVAIVAYHAEALGIGDIASKAKGDKFIKNIV
jgi:hypothetical protein